MKKIRILPSALNGTPLTDEELKTLLVVLERQGVHVI